MKQKPLSIEEVLKFVLQNLMGDVKKSDTALKKEKKKMNREYIEGARSATLHTMQNISSLLKQIKEENNE